MTTSHDPLIENHVDIAAPSQIVWDLISDVRRMPEWSPDVVSTRLRTGFDRIDLSTQFTNLNRVGAMEWTTHGEIVQYEPHRAIAYRITENWVIWSMTLDTTPAGTRLTQRRETPDGISDYSLDLTDRYFGGQDAFTQRLRDGMRETLGRIKAAAERIP